MGWCCWRVLEACKPDHVTPCLKPSAPAPTACGSSSVTTLLLTFMPSPRCPSYPECPSPASHLANSSFETRLRGPLQDALPAPSRLGKMPLVCIFIMELITCPVSWAHACVCPAPPRPHWIVLLQGKGQLLCHLRPRPTSTTENV